MRRKDSDEDKIGRHLSYKIVAEASKKENKILSNVWVVFDVLSC